MELDPGKTVPGAIRLGTQRVARIAQVGGAGALTLAPLSTLGVEMAPPNGPPTLVPSPSGGSLTSGAYLYVVTSLDGAGGETVPSLGASTAVTGPNGSVTVS